MSKLHWADLLPFTRRPLFIILESHLSREFFGAGGEEWQAKFDAPTMVLLAPSRMPPKFEEHGALLSGSTELPMDEMEGLSPDSHKLSGSLLTLFLTSPVKALCEIWRIRRLPSQSVLLECEKLLLSVLSDLYATMVRVVGNDAPISVFLTDRFTRAFLLRFVFARFALSRLEPFSAGAEFLPSCRPAVPIEVYECEALLPGMCSLARALGQDEFAAENSGSSS